MTEEYWSRFQATFDENQEYVVGKDLLDDVKENRFIQTIRVLPKI